MASQDKICLTYVKNDDISKNAYCSIIIILTWTFAVQVNSKILQMSNCNEPTEVGGNCQE